MKRLDQSARHQIVGIVPTFVIFVSVAVQVHVLVIRVNFVQLCRVQHCVIPLLVLQDEATALFGGPKSLYWWCNPHMVLNPTLDSSMSCHVNNNYDP